MRRARHPARRPMPPTRTGRERQCPYAGCAAQARASRAGADFADPPNGSGGVSTGSAAPRRSVACPSTRRHGAKTAPARSVVEGCPHCRRVRSPNGQAPPSPDASTSGRVRSGRRSRPARPLGAGAGQSPTPHAVATGPRSTSDLRSHGQDRSDGDRSPAIDPSQERGAGQVKQAHFAVKQSLNQPRPITGHRGV